MSRDDSRLGAVLGELADLGRRISERATELAGLVGEAGARVPPGLAERLADVTTSTADLAAAAAVVTAATETTPHKPPAAADAPRQRIMARPVRHAAKQKPASPQPRRVRSRVSTAVATAHRPIALDGRRLRPLMPALVSTAVNIVAILGMALIFVAAEAKPKRPVLTLGAPEETFIDEMTPVEFETSVEAPAASEQAADQFPELAMATADAVAIDDVSLDDAAFVGDPATVTPVSFDAVDALADVGGVGGKSEEAVRGGGSAGGGQPSGGSFFGRTGQGQTVCFICDNSNSYRDGGFHAVLDEVARTVDSLRPEQSFFVVFFSDTAYPMFHPERVDALQPASPANKQRLRAWLATVEMCGGGQGIDEAVRLAERAGAEVVYFLSDGEHSASVVDRVVSADFGSAVVHTFGMQQGVLDRRTGQVDPDRLRRQQGFNQNLVAIASAHGGTFTPVTVPPQAAAFERLRPIHRNRAPGPVWGLKL
ncbi:MAG: VWA domain-containing protein [Pirellulales bacterium]|jgi:hypothetical protein